METLESAIKRAIAEGALQDLETFEEDLQEVHKAMTALTHPSIEIEKTRIVEYQKRAPEYMKLQ